MQNPAIRAAVERANAMALPLFDERGVFAFDVYGHPVAQGSMVPLWSKHLNRCIAKPDSPDMDRWRKHVAATASIAMAGRAPVGKHKPLLLGCVFRIDRERTTKSGAHRAGAGNDWPVVGQDFDKLVRAINDALTGVVFHDDGQVVGMLPWSYKRWTVPGERPGVSIRLCPVAGVQRELLQT